MGVQGDNGIRNRNRRVRGWAAAGNRGGVGVETNNRKGAGMSEEMMAVQESAPAELCGGG